MKEIEVPYELPEGWAWSRLSNISDSIQYGYTASAKKHGDVKLLRITDIQNNFVDWANVPYCDIEENKFQNLKLVNGDIVIARTGGTIGKSFLIENLPEASVFASYLIRIQLNQIDSSRFIKLFIESPLYWNQLTKLSGGTGQPNVNATNLKTLLLPIPPKLEQQKIILEIEQYFKLVQSIETEQESLNQLSDQLKKKVLETAMQGKLVPQDPSDEPASVLLKKIRAEKQRLYEEGKLKKKDLQESIIYKGDDNSYHEKFLDGTVKKNAFSDELPKNWSYARLPSLVALNSNAIRRGPFGSAIKKSMFVPFGNNVFKVYEQGNAIQKRIDYGEYYLTYNDFKRLESFEVHPNDIIISCAGTIGEVFVIPQNAPKGIINQALLKLTINPEVMTISYFLLAFENITEFLRATAAGTAMKNLGSVKFLKQDIIFKLPPIVEQKRITSRYNHFLSQIENIFL